MKTLLIIISIFAALFYQHALKAETPQYSIGRYQIVRQNDSQSFLLDTATGQTWTYGAITNKAGTGIIDTAWTPSKKFDSPEQMQEFYKKNGQW